MLIISVLAFSCQPKQKSSMNNEIKIRNLVDTIGFAQYPWQMDSIIARIQDVDKEPVAETYKAIICPHDDYAYAAGLYYKTLAGIKAKTVLLIGVAHKAKNFNLQDKLVFGSFDQWKSANGNVKVSALRNELLSKLSPETYVVNDSMMQTEHSLEAIVPFLQRNNKHVEIIPVLVPYMSFEDMEKFSSELSDTLQLIMKNAELSFGKDLAIVISNDAVHYGDEDWGDKNMAPFGTDSTGNERAHQKELSIIDQCLKGELTDAKIKLFNEYTVQPNDYKEYNWVWCGRYSVSFGLLVANKLNQLIENKPLEGTLVDYRSSLLNQHIDVNDIGMGVTAPANPHHWVGYVGMWYK